jgi:glycosyltransferase involved in cell wall biosynthesis
MLLSNAFRPDPRVLKEAESLCGQGHNLAIICWDRKKELKSEELLPSGVKIIRIQNIRSDYGTGIRQLLRVPYFWWAIKHNLRELNPDIIHCHDFDTLPAGLLYGFFQRIPVIYDAHEYYAELIKPRLKGIIGWFIRKLVDLFEGIGAHYVNAVVTVDTILAEIYRKYNNNVIILGHYPIKSMAMRSNPVFSRSVLTLIYSGRLSIDRGILIYSAILRKLLEVGIPTRLKLAGTFTPENEQEIFFENAKDVKDFIDYLGWTPYEKISENYHSADIGLAILLPEPRYVAATPVKLFEYMASGLPVIASNFPAISHIVNDANCGLLVEPMADITSTVKNIKTWYENKTIPKILGENGRQAIISKYNWENQIASLIDFYNTLS